jgi:hypothetical protein
MTVANFVVDVVVVVVIVQMPERMENVLDSWHEVTPLDRTVKWMVCWTSSFLEIGAWMV